MNKHEFDKKVQKDMLKLVIFCMISELESRNTDIKNEGSHSLICLLDPDTLLILRPNAK